MLDDSDQTLEVLFQEALAQPEAARAAFLDAACANDPLLRQALKALLEAGSPMDGDPPPGAPAPRRSAMLQDPAVAVGSQVGPYRLVRVLGSGGMGTVYLARRDDLGTEAAVKLIRPGAASPATLERFLHEQRLLARLQHPHIARLLDAGLTAPDTPNAGLPYLILEYVEGRPLTDYCDHHQLSLDARLKLFAQVCAAVHHAHQNLIVHRDLKPANILVAEGTRTTDTLAGQVKLLDFGIAKLLDTQAHLPDLTGPGGAPMTPAYAAPEQRYGGPVTTATDVYALGVILYELLTGYRPAPPDAPPVPAAASPAPPVTYPVSDLRRPSARIVDTPAAAALWAARGTPPERLRRRLRGDLDLIILRALHPDPAHRYPSAEALLEDLRRHERGLTVRARPDSPGYRLRTFVRRNKVAVGAALAVALALVTGLSVALWQARVAQQERNVAEQVSAFMVDLFNVANPETEGAIRADTLRLGALLARGVNQAEATLDQQPEVQARIFDTIAELYRVLGRYDEAEALFGQAADRWEARYGGPSPDLARSLKYQAYARMQRGALDEAEALQREVLAMRLDLLGPEHASTASILKNLGTTLKLKGQFAEALPYYERALDIRRKVLEPKDNDIPNLLMVQGELHLLMGHTDAAETALTEALEIFEALPIEKRLNEPLTRHHLAEVRHLQGRPEEAETLHRAALALQTERLGTQHPWVALSLHLLAEHLRRTGRQAEAEPLFRESLERFDATSPEILDAARPRVALARLLLATGQAQVALPWLHQADTIRRTHLPEGHWQIAEVQGLLGAVYAALGLPEEARRNLLQSHAILLDTRGPEDERTREMAGYLAALE